MKILFQSRKTLFDAPGGDTTQILKTQKYIRRAGHEVDISVELEPDVRQYDVVHLFNLIRPQEICLQAQNAKRYQRPLVLSTIYGLYTEFDRKARGGVYGSLARILSPNAIEYMKVLARAVLNREIHKGTVLFLRYGYRRLQREICEMTDAFLPNSITEMQRVENDLDLNNTTSFVVPNAVDSELFDFHNTTLSDWAAGFEGCVLCVARIEGRKSQLNLIRAMQGLPYRLVLVGMPGANSRGYYEQCRRAAARVGNIELLGQVPHEMLPQLYKAARVHALVSWMETPGLSSLEAAAMRCNLVITDRGDTRAYFGDRAEYCEPDDLDSIRRAVVRAYEGPPRDDLMHTILREYTWSRAAQQTIRCYEQVVAL